MYSRHLKGAPHTVGTDYYFDVERLTAHFPRVRESAYLKEAFPAAVKWPPTKSLPVVFLKLADNEQLCGEVYDSDRLEALGNVNETCPPLSLPPNQLITTTASGYHLGASESQIRSWLAPYSHEPLLYFARMFRRFQRFSSETDHNAFLERYAKGVRPAPDIQAVANEALTSLRTKISNNFGGVAAFDCVHMRRRDFIADHKEEESIEQYAARAAAKLTSSSTKNGNNKHHHNKGGGVEPRPVRAVYLASDVAEDPTTKAAFAQSFGKGTRIFTLESIFPSSRLDAFTSTRKLSKLQIGSSARHAALAREMRFGNVEQLVCSRAERFVGNKWSSFSHHVCYLRERNGQDCKGSDVYDREIDPAMPYV